MRVRWQDQDGWHSVARHQGGAGCPRQPRGTAAQRSASWP